jgi:hypothetical protein
VSSFTFPIDGLSQKTIEIKAPLVLPSASTSPISRTIYAAVHVVANSAEASASNISATVDWDATAKFRQHMWSLGLGVAEAMDTAQRGMGMDWESVKTLVARTMKDAKAVGGSVVSGVATDQLSKGVHTLAAIEAAYKEQLEFTLSTGATPVLMCSRDLAATARSSDDYLELYSKLIEHSDQKVVLHWLGSMFDPLLAGYWGGAGFHDVKENVLELINRYPDKIDGIKMSLLNEDCEIELREKLPAAVKMYTGDDFNYVRLIRGNGKSYSHALLGAFAAIGPFASAAVRALDDGNLALYEKILGPTESLSRELFKTPTYYYKTGVVWLAYLSGMQDHFTMVAGLQSGRSIRDLCELYILANEIGLFTNPDLALSRMKKTLDFAGLKA